MLGAGSFGTVYEIERDVFGKTEKAALKVIEIPKDESEIDFQKNDGMHTDDLEKYYHDSLMQIVEEYKMMMDLKDVPNIVRCEDFQYIQNENKIGWTVFIRMELLTPLRSWKREQELYEETEIVKLATDICRALDELEKRGIIHRDIKPSNIFISENGLFKLGDLGVAEKITDYTYTSKAGTMSYMAPEIYLHGKATYSSDIYSLGLTLYWLMNEHHQPFLTDKMTSDDREQALVKRIRGEAIPEPKNGSIELKNIVLKACSYDIEKRYKNAAEMLADLNRLTFHTQFFSVNSTENFFPKIFHNMEENSHTGSAKTGEADFDWRAYDSDFFTDFGTTQTYITVPKKKLIWEMLKSFKEKFKHKKNDEEKVTEEELTERNLAKDAEALVAFMSNLKTGE